MSAGTCAATGGGSAKESGLPIAAADQAGAAAEPSQSASAGTHDRPLETTTIRPYQGLGQRRPGHLVDVIAVTASRVKRTIE
jgi:hypothetical protein